MECSSCGCSCSLINNLSACATWNRTVKRKIDEIEEGRRDGQPGSDFDAVARVEVENECDALREALSSQQESIQELHIELEEERNASASAADEAMAMILRLQREKAEVTMEARQFKRYAEEKIAHDQQEILALEDMVFKREEVIQSLSCEVQMFKHRMMSFGLTEDEAEGSKGFYDSRQDTVENADAEFEIPPYDYPPLRCNMNVTHEGPLDFEDVADIEKYTPAENLFAPFGDTPRSTFSDTPRAIFGETPKSSTKVILEKVVVGQSPMRTRHIRKSSMESSSSFSGLVKEIGVYNEYVTTPRDSLYQTDIGDPDIKKLYTRLQMLEADRESMKQAIISMRTEKAQLVILKELAQQLYRDMSPERKMPVRKSSLIGTFSFMSALKWIVSLVFWKNKAQRSKYMFGLSASNVGLLLLLDKNPHMRQWRCLTRAQM